MRILILTHKPPYTYIDGGVLAIRNLMEAIADIGHQVDVLSFETKKHPFLPPEEFPSNISVQSVFKDTDIKVHEAFIGLFRKGSYNVDRFQSVSYADKIKELTSQANYGMVILESLFSTSYLSLLRELTDCPIILRSHNIEHKIWERLVQEETSFLKRAYLTHLCKRLKKYEENTIKALDGVMYISDLDEAFFKNTQVPSTVIPFVRSINEEVKRPTSISFFHLGSMDWKPNKNGIEWLLDNVWPIVRKEYPDARLNLAGKDMPSNYFKMAEKGVFAKDYVSNGDTYMQEHGIMLVPLFSGGGIRIKIIDGLCNGVPIISTKIGAEGIPYTTGENIIIANTKEEFAGRMIEILRNKHSLEAISSKALALAKSNFTKESIKPKLREFFTQITKN